MKAGSCDDIHSTVLEKAHCRNHIGSQKETSIVKSAGARFKVNIISALSSQGVLRIMVTESGLTAALFVQFLERLTKDQEKPVYLIEDGQHIHKAKVVDDFVSSQNGFL